MEGVATRLKFQEKKNPINLRNHSCWFFEAVIKKNKCMYKQRIKVILPDSSWHFMVVVVVCLVSFLFFSSDCAHVQLIYASPPPNPIQRRGETLQSCCTWGKQNCLQLQTRSVAEPRRAASFSFFFTLNPTSNLVKIVALKLY